MTEIQYELERFPNHDEDDRFKLALYFDVEAPFKSTIHQPILNKLVEYGIDNKLHNLMIDYFHDRSNLGKVNSNGIETTKEWRNERGVFQGTNLASYLWNVFMLNVKDKLQ